MRISDWSSDVCSSDLIDAILVVDRGEQKMLALGREIDDSSPRNGLIYSPSDRRRTKVLKRPIGEGLAQLTLSLLGCGRERLDAAILGVSRRCCADQRCREQLSAAGHDWTPENGRAVCGERGGT